MIGRAKVPALLAAVLWSLAAGTLRLGAGEAGLSVRSSDIQDAEDAYAGSGAPSISMVGARNGGYSGKVAVSGAAIKGLKASISELKQGSEALPAGCVKVRYAAPWDGGVRGYGQPKGVDILHESPPATIDGGKAAVWVTVEVPKQAKAGVYKGELSVQADGLSTVKVPVQLDVRDWTLPDTQNYRTWVELIQSPDTLALEYGVPLWSEKHWAMIARSFDYMNKVGSRVLYIPLIVGTNYGNDQTMVRWIKKGENSYSYDFSIMEKYLDLAQQHLGRPKLVILQAWDIFQKAMQGRGGDVGDLGGAPKGGVKGEGDAWAKRAANKDRGPGVTLLDPASGKIETAYLPRFDKPEAKALWKALFDELKPRIAKRELDQDLLLGMLSDHAPNKEETATLQEASGGLPWASCSHHWRWKHDENGNLDKAALNGIADIRYASLALDYYYVINPALARSYGWKDPYLHGVYWRFGVRFGGDTLAVIRNEPECNITGKQRGITHLGADFWPALKNGDRRTGTVSDRYLESMWHSLNIGSYLLAPGADGPVATARYEVFREGVQDCEARIAIEEALTDPARKSKLGDLAAKAQAVLDERHLALWKAQGATQAKPRKPPDGPWYDTMTVGLIQDYQQYAYEFDIAGNKAGHKAEGVKWWVSSGWAERNAKLYDAARDVQAGAK